MNSQPERQQKAQTIASLETEYDLVLCQRDYNLLVEHQPDLLDILERIVTAGIAEQALKRWTMRRVGEPILIQRIMNAAMWIRRSGE